MHGDERGSSAGLELAVAVLDRLKIDNVIVLVLLFELLNAGVGRGLSGILDGVAVL